MEEYITIVGCGPGNRDLLTEAAKKAVAEADCLIGSIRLLDMFPGEKKEKVDVGADVKKALDEIARRRNGKKIALLVSGDPGLCSLAKPVIKEFGAGACRVVPGISSVQYAFAKLGVDWRDAKIITAHAKNPVTDEGLASGHGSIAVLAGTDAAMEWICGFAKKLGGGWRLFICENLSLPEEKIAEVEIGRLAGYKAATRTVALFLKKEGGGQPPQGI